jgi:hypothetical protein
MDELGLGWRRGLFGFLAKQLAVRSTNEMQPTAGLAGHGFISALRIFRIWFVREPMLHVHTGPRTFENDISHGIGH